MSIEKVKRIEWLCQHERSFYLGNEIIKDDLEYSTALNLIALHCVNGIGGDVDNVINKMMEHFSAEVKEKAKKHAFSKTYYFSLKKFIQKGGKLNSTKEEVLDYAADYFTKEILIDRSVIFLVRWLRERNIEIEGEFSIVKETSLRRHTFTGRSSPIEDCVDCFIYNGTSYTDSFPLLIASDTRYKAMEAFKKEVVWTI